MKNTIEKIICGIFCVLTFSCSNLINENDNPYDGATKEFSVQLVYPSGFNDQVKDGVKVTINDINWGYTYTAETNADGLAKFTVQNGTYRVSVSEKILAAGSIILFNGTKDGINIIGTDAEKMNLELELSRSGQILIKEIYCGGCTKKPQTGTYTNDKYIILYNNSAEVAYLDSLCFGMIDPYNSNANNPWSLDGKIPIADVVWQFPGSGTDHALQPGEQAVVAINGAIDHTSQFPESVNLNKSEYYVCYNSTMFNNASFHPTPGNNIRPDHILDILIKTGIANAFSFSQSSPGAFIFNVPVEESSAREFVNNSDNIQQKPGSSARCVVLPNDWVLDAVEVFNGATTTNNKRFPSTLDAGFVYLTSTTLRYTLYRNVDLDETLAIEGNAEKLVYNYTLGSDPSGVDAEASIKNGARIVYMDTNNSSNDFHQRTLQSLSGE